jgi:hypothetical protein
VFPQVRGFPVSLGRVDETRTCHVGARLALTGRATPVLGIGVHLAVR